MSNVGTYSRSIHCPNCGMSCPSSSYISYGQAVKICMKCQTPIYDKNVKEIALVSYAEVAKLISDDEKIKEAKGTTVIICLFATLGMIFAFIWNWKVAFLLLCFLIVPMVAGFVFWIKGRYKKSTENVEEMIFQSINRLQNDGYASLVIYFQGMQPGSRYGRYLYESGKEIPHISSVSNQKSEMTNGSGGRNGGVLDVNIEPINKKIAQIDLKSGIKMKGITLGYKYIYVRRNSTYIPIYNLLWFYKHKDNVKHTTSFGRVLYSETFLKLAIVFCERKKDGSIKIKKSLVDFGGGTNLEMAERNIDSFLSSIRQRAPYAIMGYHEEIEVMVDKHPNDLILIVDRNKKQNY